MCDVANAMSESCMANCKLYIIKLFLEVVFPIHVQELLKQQRCGDSRQEGCKVSLSNCCYPT